MVGDKLYNKSMKKVLKTIFIIILCIAVAGGTGYLFFQNMTKTEAAFDTINSFSMGVGQKELTINMRKVASTGGTRFNLLLDSFDDMQDCVLSLNVYLLDYRNASTENLLANNISSLNAETGTLQTMIEEYNIKCTHAEFDKLKGADSLYNQFAKYLIDYSAFVSTIKDNVLANTTTKDIDAKFSVIDVYINVITVSLTSQKLADNNFENLSYMQSHFSLVNGYLQFNGTAENFSSQSNKFIKEYSKCDKVSFATNLKENMKNASESSDNAELVACYYLKSLLGA